MSLFSCIFLKLSLEVHGCKSDEDCGDGIKKPQYVSSATKVLSKNKRSSHSKDQPTHLRTTSEACWKQLTTSSDLSVIINSELHHCNRNFLFHKLHTLVLTSACEWHTGARCLIVTSCLNLSFTSEDASTYSGRNIWCYPIKRILKWKLLLFVITSELCTLIILAHHHSACSLGLNTCVVSEVTSLLMHGPQIQKFNCVLSFVQKHLGMNSSKILEEPCPKSLSVHQEKTTDITC